VVVALRSRRLETLFGVPLDHLVASHLEALVTSGTQESFDLDYKRDLYGGGDSDRRKLAGDVAALANTAGGVIVLGIDEDDQARAIDAPGVVVTDAEISRIRQVVAALVAPVPMFDVLPVLKDIGESAAVDGDSSSSVGFIVIAVPRSSYAPHAVLVNDALRFPKRNGSTTRYLSEPELAAAYRDRFAGGEIQIRRTEEIEHDALARLDTSDLPWVVVSLVPDLPGDFTISQKAYRQFQQEIIQTRVGPFGSSVYTRAWTGRRRLLADGTGDQSPLARWAALDLHTNGAGVYAVQIADLTKRHELRGSPAADNDALPPVQLVDDESVVLEILSGLLVLAQHARDRAATGGGVLLRAQIHPISAQRPTQIGHTRSFGGSRSRHSLTEPPPPAETSAALDDLAAAGSDLVAVACRLADELGQAFGVPEMGQLTSDGQIRRKYWNHDMQANVVAWAEANDIKVSDETIEQ
jgi:Putative DNA-binding domain